MTKTTISIVLSDAEIKALSAMQISENESLNKTADRLLKGILGQSKVEQTPSDDEEIKQVIKQELADAIVQIKGLINERLGEVANPEQEAVCVEQQVIPDYELIREKVLSKFKVGKQSAAKAIDAFIEELDAVTFPEQAATEGLDVAS
ncbi:hypothetical protein A6770_40325 [Nostoc minutum NIES-26]|uniref:Uncharacterized protein n=1 Tax=Nostoc minutum NIES-26 TaxID=1844469 RepID=A0A367RML7_9NOSO|nr:hypothetical protein A6770_40325 [Nostoc minutum NIES-26]